MGSADALDWQGMRLRTSFQPVYSVRRAGFLGYEALLRASGGDGLAVRPERLFREAFAGGEGMLLDWVCRALHLRSFACVDPGEGRLFLNVHPQAAAGDADRARDLRELISWYGVSPSRVCVEILETPCADEGLLRDAVEGYRGIGVGIAMDDFGLGRSNLDRIVALRPDFVKLERATLVQAIGDGKARRMLPAVIQLLKETGAQVAVEGIETASEALIAIDSGADHLQGYYFATPTANLGEEAIGRELLSRLLRMRAAQAARTA